MRCAQGKRTDVLASVREPVMRPGVKGTPRKVGQRPAGSIKNRSSFASQLSYVSKKLRGAPSHSRVKPPKLPSVRAGEKPMTAVVTELPGNPAPPFRLTFGKVAPLVNWNDPYACEPARRSSPPVRIRILIDDTKELLVTATGPRLQMLVTSCTHRLSQAVVQQNGSTLQMLATQESQVEETAVPVSQIE